MRRSRQWLLGIALAILIVPVLAAEPQQEKTSTGPDRGTAQESEDPVRAAFNVFITHLRANFEDIHEVSMRFHRVDPTLNGMMVVEMTWQDGQLQAATVIENETNEAEAQAILEVLKSWEIDELTGPVTFSVPFRFRIVGSDDPSYPEMAILTGIVKDRSGQAIHDAQIELIPREESHDPIRARANREGVFVRTLIPPGAWDIVCTADGFGTAKIAEVSLDKGEHRIVDFDLKPTASQP